MRDGESQLTSHMPLDIKSNQWGESLLSRAQGLDNKDPMDCKRTAHEPRCSSHMKSGPCSVFLLFQLLSTSKNQISYQTPNILLLLKSSNTWQPRPPPHQSQFHLPVPAMPSPEAAEMALQDWGLSGGHGHPPPGSCSKSAVEVELRLPDSWSSLSTNKMPGRETGCVPKTLT